MKIEKKISELRKICLDSSTKKFPIKTPCGPYIFFSNLNWERYIKGIKYYLNFVPNGGKVLDVGCGIGHTTCISKIMRKDIDIYGFDIQKNLIWKRLAEYNVDFLICNTEYSCFEDESFDIVISFGVIEHTKNRNLFIKEIKRILKPGGYFFVFDLPSKYSFSEAFLGKIIQFLKNDKIFFHEKMYIKKEVKDVFLKNGFSVVVKEQFLIPAQVDRISRFICNVFNKNYKNIIKIDQLILKTPLKIFSQAFMVKAKKL